VIDWGSAHILQASLGQFADPFVPLNQEVVQTDRGEAMSTLTDSPLATSVGGLPITPYFVPPEVLSGKADAFGPATDVYSLGVMLYELLAGRMPYSKADGSLLGAADLRTFVTQGPPPPIRRLNRNVSRDLAAIASKATAHAQADRYPSMEELADDIRAALTVRPVQARRPGPFLVLQKWVQRNAAIVLLGALSLGVASAAFAIQRGLRAERNVARQVTALRSAELATRSGRWRDALQYWREAETAGYADAVNLGLQRAGAWAVLSETDRALAELQKLSRRHDLGDQRGAVLLQLGECELYDRQTFKQGLEHVREAQACRLSAANQAFAQGVLATTTPEALKYFLQALQCDPYHHGAHVHSLGLEYLLGQHEESRTHAQVCRILFPDDASADFLEASELAFDGRLAEAEQKLASLRDAASPEVMKQLAYLLRLKAGAAKEYDVETIIERSGQRSTNREPVGAYDSAMLFDPNVTETPQRLRTFRTPQLPCLQAGLLEGAAALSALFLPSTNSIDPVVQKIKASWRCHPEATLPFMTAHMLDKRQPTEGRKSLPLLAAQSELYQLAADSASVTPGLSRTARYLAVQAQRELALSGEATAPAFRQQCLENLRQAATANDTAAAECRVYFDLAFELGELDLARQLLDRWQQRQPLDSRLLRSRIRLEVAAGAFGSALRLLDQLPPEDPTNVWAQSQRQTILRSLNDLTKQVSNSH
jgi:hypothetical protein